MSSASFNGYTYFTNDPVFIYHINNGITEPYPVDLEIVNKYFKMFPHKNGTYIDVGAHIGTTIIPYLPSSSFFRFEPIKPFVPVIIIFSIIR